MVVSGRSSEKLTKDWFLKRRSVAFLSRSKPEKIVEYKNVPGRKSETRYFELMSKTCFSVLSKVVALGRR